MITLEQFKGLQVGDQVQDQNGCVWEVEDTLPNTRLVCLSLVGKVVGQRESRLFVTYDGAVYGLTIDTAFHGIFKGGKSQIVPPSLTLLLRRLVEGGTLTEAQASSLISATTCEK